MRQFLAGCVFGIVLSGVGYTAAEQAIGSGAGGAEARKRKPSSTAGPRLVGDSGYLNGVDVKYRLGDRICSDPWVWMEGRRATIECDKR